MDMRNQLLLLGTTDRYFHATNLFNPTSIYKNNQSPLKWQREDDHISGTDGNRKSVQHCNVTKESTA